jgi:hypothetical protein
MDALMPRSNPAYDANNSKNKNSTSIYAKASNAWKKQDAKVREGESTHE